MKTDDDLETVAIPGISCDLVRGVDFRVDPFRHGTADALAGVGQHIGGSRRGVAPAASGRAVAPLHEEPATADRLPGQQPTEFDVAAAIHDIDRRGLRWRHVHAIAIVDFAVGDVHERRNRSKQNEQRVYLDRRLGVTERRPGKLREAQIDDYRIQCVVGFLQVDPDGAGRPSGFALSLPTAPFTKPNSLVQVLTDCRATPKRCATSACRTPLLSKSAPLSRFASIASKFRFVPMRHPRRIACRHNVRRFDSAVRQLQECQ